MERCFWISNQLWITGLLLITKTGQATFAVVNRVSRGGWQTIVRRSAIKQPCAIKPSRKKRVRSPVSKPRSRHRGPSFPNLLIIPNGNHAPEPRQRATVRWQRRKKNWRISCRTALACNRRKRSFPVSSDAGIMCCRVLASRGGWDRMRNLRASTRNRISSGCGHKRINCLNHSLFVNRRRLSKNSFHSVNH